MFSHPTPPNKINIMRKIHALKCCSRLKDNFVTVGYELKFLARLFCRSYYQRWCLSWCCLANKTEGGLCLCLWRHDALHHCNWMVCRQSRRGCRVAGAVLGFNVIRRSQRSCCRCVHMYPAKVKEEAVMSKLNVWDLLLCFSLRDNDKKQKT